jgi:NitT/TauT family transport system substrate-binding protein
MYEEAADPHVHRVLNSYDVLGGPHTFNVVWSTTRYADAHPVVLQAFRAALERAMASIRDDPAAAAAIWVRVEKARLSQEQAADMVRRPENDWTTTPKRMMEFARFMHAGGAIKELPADWRDLFFTDAASGDGS